VSLLFRSMVRPLFLMCLLLTVAGCKVELYTNLDEVAANEVTAALLMAGIPATKKTGKDGIAIMVKERMFGEAVELLNSKGLPNKKYNTVGELFNDDGLVASPMQEWARFNYARSQELSASLSSIPGVVKADVHIGENRSDSPFDEPIPPSVSVLLQVQEGIMTREFVPQIKQLVALSHPEVEYDRVGVIVSTMADVASSNPPVVNVGGILVHPDSEVWIKALLGSIVALFLTVCGMGAFILILKTRGKRVA